MMSRVEQKMLEAETSLQEAQTTHRTITDLGILIMKADNYESEDLEIFLTKKEFV